MTRTIHNARNGETLTTTCDDMAAAIKFASTANPDHWLWYWVHKHVAEQSKPDYTEGVKFLKHMFILAIGYGLKRPKIRVVHGTSRFKLYLSQRGSLCIKRADRLGTSDNFSAEAYVGCIYNGKFLKARGFETDQPTQRFLDEMAADPIGFMADCSRDLGQCCYCGKQLDNEASKTVGYGATCAKRWGLPWGKDVDDEKAPTFARLYDDEVIEILDRVALSNTTEHWMRFNAWLSNHTLPAVTQPGPSVTLPAA